jgi:ubiquinone/menaquinone biosynthesis C-methylase UbiE
VTKRNIQFEQIATEYDESLPPHVVEHYLVKRTRFLTSQWGNSPARALDVGAGTGVLAARLQAQGWQVMGVDQAKAMLELMADRGNPAAQASGVQLPFPDNTFDVVYCVAVLHHVAEPEAVKATVREMLRITRPGGVAVYWDHNPFNPYWPIIMARVPQDTGEERLIPEKEIRDALKGLPVAMTSRQSGFVGDFVPLALLKLFQILERIVESIPGVRRILCAHNVVVARKLQG